MTLIEHRSYINFVPNVSPPTVINVGQYDDAFLIVLYPVMVKRGIVPPYPATVAVDPDLGIIIDDSGRIAITLTAEVRGTKKDGNGYSAPATISTDGKAFVIEGNKQMTAIAGENTFELVVSYNYDDEVLSSANFILNVERAAMDADTVPSESVIREIDEAVAEYMEDHNIVIDSTLTQAGKAADAKAVGDALANIDIEVDDTLTEQGKAADAKKVGDEITSIKEDLSEIVPGLSDAAKTALLACFEHVAWIDDDGQDYYDALESSLYPANYPKIVAVFNSGQNTIYTDDSLNSLKQYLTVTYFETAESTGTVIQSANYTLSGALVVGTSTITVAYNNLTTSFMINNVVDFYNIINWSTSDLLGVTVGNIVTEKLPQIVSNTGVINRAIVTCPHGKEEILQYNNNNPIPFTPSKYPIPIPNGATSATITCTGGRPIMSIFRYDNNQYTRLEEINNTQWGNATFEISQTGQNLFAMFLMVIGDNNPPGAVTIEYGFD